LVLVVIHQSAELYDLGGFGLGALNDADEDDLDVYDSVQQKSRRGAAYDLADGDNNETIVIGKTTEKGKPSVRLSLWLHLLA